MDFQTKQNFRKMFLRSLLIAYKIHFKSLISSEVLKMVKKSHVMSWIPPLHNSRALMPNTECLHWKVGWHEAEAEA